MSRPSAGFVPLGQQGRHRARATRRVRSAGCSTLHRESAPVTRLPFCRGWRQSCENSLELGLFPQRRTDIAVLAGRRGRVRQRHALYRIDVGALLMAPDLVITARRTLVTLAIFAARPALTDAHDPAAQDRSLREFTLTAADCAYTPGVPTPGLHRSEIERSAERSRRGGNGLSKSLGGSGVPCAWIPRGNARPWPTSPSSAMHRVRWRHPRTTSRGLAVSHALHDL